MATWAAVVSTVPVCVPPYINTESVYIRRFYFLAGILSGAQNVVCSLLKERFKLK